ncbi:unnamed protein product [Linum trigynum]|uniref:Uncharacterized protein n=1 Tax=Linum trigynum TaxID=586398 RepID=A0AAV2CZK2_9ROSI
MSRWLARVPPSVKPSLTKQDTSMAQWVSYQVKSSSGKRARQSRRQASYIKHQAVEQRLPRGGCTTVTRDGYK